MKQSSIEWLVDEINVHLNFDQRLYLKELLEQAKAMHKEEIRKAYWNGEYHKEKKLTIEYYNETFNTKEK